MKEGCKNWILVIKYNIAYPRPHPQSFSPPDVDIGWADLPEVYLLGALHGDDSVGLTVVVDIASLLLEYSWYDSIPSRTSYYNDTDIMAKVEEFRSNLEGRGVEDVDRRWLSIFFMTRSIFIVPTMNAPEYDHKSCTEDGIDPNQDFPYNLMDRTLCMRTIYGQTINKIFGDHSFWLSFTFHGGMEAIV